MFSEKKFQALYWHHNSHLTKVSKSKNKSFNFHITVFQSSEETPTLSPVRHRKKGTHGKKEANLIHRVSFSEACIPSTDEQSVEEEEKTRKLSLLKLKEPTGVEATVPSDLKDKPEGYFLKHPLDASTSTSRIQDE